MSLLDTIKNLFCTKNSNTSESIINVTDDIKEEKPTPTAHSPIEKAPSTPTPASEQSIALEIPQDSALKRHYISALKTRIETEMGSYPSDSTLKRQYNATVQTKLDELLN